MYVCIRWYGWKSFAEEHILKKIDTFVSFATKDIHHMSQKHFSWEVSSSKIGFLKFSNTQDTMNVLHGEALTELKEHLEQIASDRSVRGLVIYSGKADHFIVGADIKDIEALRDSPEDPLQKVEEGASFMQGVFQQLEDLKISTVCAIHGPCLGGGLELALACNYRLLSNDPKTKLGFPEVQLGLIPGAGGTQRLPKLIGLIPSLELIPSAKKIPAKKAVKLGLAHGMVGERQLIALAEKFAHKSTRPSVKPKKKGFVAGTLPYLLMERNPFGRKLVFSAALKKIAKQSGGFYPAPKVALAAIKDGYQLPLSLGLKKEAKHFAGLAMSPESASLIHLFHATSHLKKSPYAAKAEEAESSTQVSEVGESKTAGASKEGSAKITTEIEEENLDRDIHQNGGEQANHEGDEKAGADPQLSLLSEASSETSSKVGIVGAGFMGSGIATLCAAKGISSRITDPSDEAIGKAYGYVASFFRKRVKRRRMKTFEMDKAIMSVSATTSGSGMKRYPVIIEAVTESLALKQTILKDMESKADDSWVFASNTSALPISDIAAVAKNPGRVVGMHFFSPAEKMPLCEVIKTLTTDDSAVRVAFRLASDLGKQVIVVNDGPGFYTTRTLAFFLAEAIRLVEEGAKVEDIDKAMTDFGFPVGPLTLLDEVGIDVGMHVLSTMIKAFPGRIHHSPHMSSMIDKKYLGRKSGIGIYRYQSRRGKSSKVGVNEAIYKIFRSGSSSSISSKEIQRRLSLIFVNESVKCLEDKILAHPYDGDVGAVFGLGFPPFLGGPFHYADTLGAKKVTQDLTDLQEKLGQSYKPAQTLKKQAASEGCFFG